MSEVPHSSTLAPSVSSSSHVNGNGFLPLSHTLTIGVRDSGVGGLTVAREIRQQLPHARLLYFADTANVPYGDRTPREVRHFALSITQFLIEQGAQIVVFACNTSSAYALQIAKKRFEVPLWGMIEPGARAALEANRLTPEAPIGVLATSATVQSRMYSRWIENLQPGARAVEVACPEFVPLVEDERAASGAALAACQQYLQPLLKAGARTVILGCTHYPLLLPALQKVAPQVRFLDPAVAVAREIAAQLPAVPGAASRRQSAAEEDRFYVSGPAAGVQNWIQQILNVAEPKILEGPVFSVPPIDSSSSQLQEIL